MSGMAHEGAFVFDNRTAGYGAEPTPECPTGDAYELRFVPVLRRLGSRLRHAVFAAPHNDKPVAARSVA
jgi:hypothetical protein